MSPAPFLAGRAEDTSDYNGARCAVTYSKPAEEYEALVSGTGLLDLCYRTLIRVVGEDRATFLNGQLSNDIVALTKGGGCAACLLTHQGKTLAVPAVYNLGDQLLLAVDAVCATVAREALERFVVADDCEFEIIEGRSVIGVVGPTAASTLEAAGLEVPADSDAWFVTESGAESLLFGRDDLRVPYFEVAADSESASALWRKMEESGGVAVGTDALEVLRIESGTPRYGIDVDDGRIALEARLEWAIHFAKGCYLGQEVIERAVSRGRLNRRICLLGLQSTVASGSAVSRAGQDEEIGVVTSACESPASGALCLAYLPSDCCEPGTALSVASVAATVLDWPRPLVMAGRG